MQSLFLRELQCAICPIARRFNRDQTEKGLESLHSFLADKPAQVRFQFSVFLLWIRIKAVLNYGRRFQNLGPVKQAILLKGLRDSRVPLFRKGLWGVSTLMKMSVYGQPDVYPLIGFHLKGFESKIQSRKNEHKGS